MAFEDELFTRGPKINHVNQHLVTEIVMVWVPEIQFLGNRVLEVPCICSTLVRTQYEQAGFSSLFLKFLPYLVIFLK